MDFIVADYGEGKSHLLELAREESLSLGFATSSFVADFDTAVLHRPKLVLRAVTKGLELPGVPGVGLMPILQNIVAQQDFTEAIEDLYERWEDQYTLRIRREELSIWPSALYAASVHPEWVEDIGRWVTGEAINIKHVRQLIAGVCTPPQRMAITARDLPSIVIGLALSLRDLGYQGLSIAADELENALSLRATPLQRARSADVLVRWEESRAPIYFLGAVTPSVDLGLEDALGSHSVEWYELEDSVDHLLRAISEDPIRIKALSDEVLLQLAAHIGALHGGVFQWNGEQAIMGDGFRVFLERAKESASPIRAFVKMIVQYLEFKEQHRSSPVSRAS